MIEVLFFAGLREALGEDRLEVPAVPGLTAQGLLEQLGQRSASWENALEGDRPVMVAINEELVSAQALLHDGDTVAFFPPVTGG